MNSGVNSRCWRRTVYVSASVMEACCPCLLTCLELKRYFTLAVCLQTVSRNKIQSGSIDCAIFLVSVQVYGLENSRMSKQVVEQVNLKYLSHFYIPQHQHNHKTTNLHRRSQRFWICTFFSAVAGSQLDERRRGAAGDQTWTAEQCWPWRPTGTFEQDSIRLPSGTDKVGKLHYIFIIFSHRSPCWWVNRSSVPASCPGILCFSGTVGRRWQAFCGQMSPSCPAPPHCTWQP